MTEPVLQYFLPRQPAKRSWIKGRTRALGRFVFGRFARHSDWFQPAASYTTIIGTTVSPTEGTIHPGVVFDNRLPISGETASEIFEAGRRREAWERRSIFRKALDRAVVRWG